MFKIALISLSAWCALASNSALANNPTEPSNRTDLHTAFKHVEDAQVERLSKEEMENTHGSWVWLPVYYAPAAMTVAMQAFHSSAYMPLYHLGHGFRTTYSNWIRPK